MKKLAVMMLMACFSMQAYSFDSHRILRKASLLLREKPPTKQEYQAFYKSLESVRTPQQKLEVVKKQAADFMKEEAFLEVLLNTVSSWTNLPALETNQEIARTIFADKAIDEVLYNDSMWLNKNQLTYYIAYGALFKESMDVNFSGWKRFTLIDEEKRFRTTLSHLDFLSRFPDTPVNKNRARANRTYLTYLCQEFIPDSFGSIDLGQLPLDSEHGTDPSCIGCHYRLDPLARLFDQWRPTLTGVPRFSERRDANGFFIYKTSEKDHFMQKASTVEGLGKVLKDFPKVQQCFTKRAWDFVMGSSAKMDSETKQNLLQTFLKRKNIKDVILELLTSDYFLEDAPLPNVEYVDIAPLFKVCASCHGDGGSALTEIDFMSYPLREDPQDNAELIKTIWRSINGSEGAMFMPPKKSGLLAFSATMLNTIQQWIQNGGYHEKSTTLTEEQIKDILD